CPTTTCTRLTRNFTSLISIAASNPSSGFCKNWARRSWNFARFFRQEFHAMAKKRVQSLRCPSCRTIVLRADPEFPFCSERCRLIDLGKWASGGYVISTPITDPESLENLNAENQNPEQESPSRERRRQ